jgi:hypothetical protein
MFIMSELEKLYSWCNDEKLYDFQRRVDPTIVDLSKAVASICGAKIDHSSSIASLIDIIDADSGPLIMILIDGLGSIQLDEALNVTKSGAGAISVEDRASLQWLASFKKSNLGTVFPSVTAPALTTLATAAWPSEHGILSWWMHLDDKDLTFEVLPWVERFSRTRLSLLSVEPEDVFSTRAACSRYRRNSAFFLSNLYIDSPFSRYCRNGLHDDSNLIKDVTVSTKDVTVSTKDGIGKSIGVGYVDYEEAVEKICRIVAADSYIYWYIPEHDALCHRSGVYSSDAISALVKISSAIRTLSKSVARGTRIIVTGDHGHVDLPPKTTYFIVEDDELMHCLQVPPFGEPSVPMFRTVSGMETLFKERFCKQFEGKAALLSKKEVVESQLLGPFKYSESTLKRLGDFIAVFPEPAALIYKKKHEKLTIPLRGVHGGLTHQEMVVPLIII